MSNSLWLTELRKEIEMAKTSGGVRGNSPMRDRQRSVSDVMKTMQRLRNTYGAKNYERIKKAAYNTLDNIVANTGLDYSVLQIRKDIKGSTLRRKRR